MRAWLYRIATNACLRLVARRPRRVRSMDYAPPRQDVHDLGDPVTEPVWLEPWLYDVPAIAAPEADPAATYLQRESVELAFAAALQHLPGTQRAVLILREVLEFSADEVANVLDTTPSSVNSALQRARKSIGERVPPRTQARESAALGRDGQGKLVDAFVRAWERADVEGLTRLLADDANFSMPPLPAWFAGRVDIERFLADRMLVTPWRLIPLRTPGYLAFACYQSDPAGGGFRLGAVNVLRIASGEIAEIAGFLDPALHRHLGLPTEWPGTDVRDLACRWPAELDVTSERRDFLRRDR
ncbi:MAG TPA: RNA polymerase subunit sigma-70 [Micromonosporaceae bacterium]